VNAHLIFRVETAEAVVGFAHLSCAAVIAKVALRSQVLTVSLVTALALITNDIRANSFKEFDFGAIT